jgi:hypothetical protein
MNSPRALATSFTWPSALPPWKPSSQQSAHLSSSTTPWSTATPPAVLRLLADYATTGQVLLLTCHEFPEYEAYPILQMAP